LKSSGDKASPCFRSFWIGKLLDKYLPIRTLLYVSFKRILISLTSFVGTPNSIRNNANSSYHISHKASVKRFVSLQFLNLIESAGLLGRGITPSQGRYLHWTSQTQNKRRHPCIEWDPNPGPQCLSGRRQFMP
jgi:hypothetical protein